MNLFKVLLQVLLILFIVCSFITLVLSVTKTTPSWKELVAIDGVRFTARNAHSTTVFKGDIWLTGGRVDAYQMYNLLTGFKTADVWQSHEKGPNLLWEQKLSLSGDYYIQNWDAKQPSSIAPWYARFGHTIDALDYNQDGADDYMILIGGYSPEPSNDLWLTEDGVKWHFCGYAEFSPRAWHASTIFLGNLWIMGGSPLNNEVWYLQTVTYVPQRVKPLTRFQFLNDSWSLSWMQAPNAPWTPRVGHQVITHYYFNDTAGETVNDARPRILLVGGYGGFPKENINYDGMLCRPDVWITYDGNDWLILNNNVTFQGRAWFAMNQMYRFQDHRLDVSKELSPRIFVFGGGNIGQKSTSKKLILTVDGRLDAWWSRNGRDWFRINYQEGGGTSVVPLYSSQEWTVSTVDSKIVYLGLWGMTIEYLNLTTGPSLLLIGGDKTDTGYMINLVYQSQNALFCDLEGVVCSNQGVCGPGTRGCICNATVSGDYCEIGEVTVN